MLVPMYVHFAGGSPQRGLTRRLRRGWWGCRPRGEKSFLSKRKKGPKKAGGTATPEAARPAARSVSHSSLPVALLASHPPCGSPWAAPKAPLGPRFPSGQFAALTRREKALYCPFWRRGSQCRAQWNCLAFTYGRSALVLAFFRRQNGRAFFPSLPIAARLSRSWHWADSTNASWDVALQLGWLRSTENSIDFFFCAWHYAHSTSVA